MNSEKIKPKKIGVFFKLVFGFVLLSTVLVTVVVSAAYLHFSKSLPDIIKTADYNPKQVTRIYGLPKPGEPRPLLAEFKKEARYVIPYDKIPDAVVKAVISAEDDQFFHHQGVNFASILRASIANFKAGRVVQGGSTITQQVAKSLLLTSERSFTRKAKELLLAQKLESNLSKQQILYLYLNQIYLGHGAYGVEAAAKIYFNKDISELTVAEAAMMAGMPQAPGKFSPHLAPKHAKDRQLYVLRRMYENRFITQAQLSEAAVQPLKIFDDHEKEPTIGPYYVEHIRKYLLDTYGEKALYEEGLEVTLPLKVDLAKASTKALKEGLRQVDKRLGFRGPKAKLKNTEEIEKKLKEIRKFIISDKLGFEVLTSDGRLEAFEAPKLVGKTEDSQLLSVNDIYDAVVTSINEKKRSIGLLMGAIKVEVPFENWKWAIGYRDPKKINLSQLFSKGDVQRIKVVSLASDGSVVGALEQEPIIQGALFSIDVATGAVLAMDGGFNFADSEFNRAFQAKRQPGSSFKSIIYTDAVERGYTPSTVIVDSPIVFSDDELGKWKPGNYEEKFYGDTTFRQALIKSRNVPTIKIVQDAGVGRIIDLAKRLGIEGDFPSDLTIALGSGGVSLFEMTKAYAIYPRQGKKVKPIFILNVKDKSGKILEENSLEAMKPVVVPPLVNEPEPIGSPTADANLADSNNLDRRVPKLPKYPLSDDPMQVMDPRVAYVMTHLMAEVVNSGTGHEAKSLQRPAAGKTGTTNDNIDAWFMGFTAQVVTGVWVGYDTVKTIGPGETGARAALPIWLDYMKTAVKDYPEADFAVPPGIVFVPVDIQSGKPVSSYAPGAIKEAFIEGTEPTGSKGERGGSVKDVRSKAGGDSDFFDEDKL